MRGIYSPEDFWSKVITGSPAVCWPWTGRVNRGGYGQLRYRGVDLTSHRLAAFFFGLVPTPRAPANRKGSGFILRQCDNPTCCNPNHFNVGTNAQNQLEAYARGLATAKKGGAASKAKLTDADVLEIRSRWPNESQEAIGKKYGVTQACISLVVREKTHVPT